MSTENLSDLHWPSLCEMFFAQAESRGGAPFLWHHDGDGFTPVSWADAARDVTILASQLRANGINQGDRVVIVSDSRPEWCISDLAIMAIGAISVPAYTTNTHRDHLHILENSGAKGAIISTRALGGNFLPAAHQSDALQFIISMDDQERDQEINARIAQWQDVMAAGSMDAGEIRQFVRDIGRTDTACLIYTSGTGGAPKGVMLSHGAVLHNCEGAKHVVDMLGIDHHRFLSFLPLSHAYEHSAGQFLPILLGAEIYYAQSLDKLGANFLDARPTVMTVVPRLFEMLQTKITRGIQKQGGIKLKLFDRALALGIKRDEGRQNPLNWAENILLDRLVRKNVRAKFGGHIEALISGGAALNPDVGSFFSALGLPLLQGYGQTESAPVIAVNLPGQAKMDTVGPPMARTEVKIAADGEILVRGELLMQGYWRNKEATEAAIQDGWLHTGDVGFITEAGHLKITDRKKDIIVLDKGDNVSPQRIEGILTLEPEIAQAMIYGEGRPYLVGLIIPDPEWLSGWAKENGQKGSIGLQEILDNPDLEKLLRKSLDDTVDRVNSELSNLERIRRYIIGFEAFSIENSMMTPTLKIRRHVINETYGKALEEIY